MINLTTGDSTLVDWPGFVPVTFTEGGHQVFQLQFYDPTRGWVALVDTKSATPPAGIVEVTLDEYINRIW